MEWINLAVMGVMGVAVVIMVWKMLKDVGGNKPKMVDIARDPDERLEKSYKIMVKGKLNSDKMRHTLWLSGDRYIQGYRVADITAIQPQNEMYKMHIKNHWWMFWKKANAIYVDPILCTDLNCKDIVVNGKGWEAVTMGVVFPIPVANTEDLEAIYIGRDNFLNARLLKQTNHDLNRDSDLLLKLAMRGDLSMAGTEISMPEMMPQVEEDAVKKAQSRRVKQDLQGGGEQ